MADTVRYLMEEMIPELDDMEKRGYFSKAELKKAVEWRTKFEYLLKRRTVLKEDFLRWAREPNPSNMLYRLAASTG